MTPLDDFREPETPNYDVEAFLIFMGTMAFLLAYRIWTYYAT